MVPIFINTIYLVASLFMEDFPTILRT